MLQTLTKNQLYAKLDKCEFWMEKIVFLGHVILAGGICMGPRKEEVVVN
jgi:hypothetical protein